MPRLTLCLLLLITGCAQDPADTSDASSLADAVPVERITDDQAGEMIYQLYVAMTKNDQATIKRLVLDQPSIRELWSGPVFDADLLEDQIARYAGIAARRVQEGERVRVNGSWIDVTDEMTSDDRRMYSAAIDGKDLELPFWMVRVGDQWKVDARLIIMGRMSFRDRR